MQTKPIIIDNYTYEDIAGIEVRITDRTVRGNYPYGTGFGPSQPLIKFCEEAKYIIPLLDRIQELEAELADEKWLNEPASPEMLEAFKKAAEDPGEEF